MITYRENVNMSTILAMCKNAMYRIVYLVLDWHIKCQLEMCRNYIADIELVTCTSCPNVHVLPVTSEPETHVVRAQVGSTCYSGYTWNRSTCELDPLVSGLVVPLGPLMQGLLETPGLTVAGHLVHGQVKVVPNIRSASEVWKKSALCVWDKHNKECLFWKRKTTIKLPKDVIKTKTGSVVLSKTWYQASSFFGFWSCHRRNSD
jgi:hypothetical protein